MGCHILQEFWKVGADQLVNYRKLVEIEQALVWMTTLAISIGRSDSCKHSHEFSETGVEILEQNLRMSNGETRGHWHM